MGAVVLSGGASLGRQRLRRRVGRRIGWQLTRRTATTDQRLSATTSWTRVSGVSARDRVSYAGSLGDAWRYMVGDGPKGAPGRAPFGCNVLDL